MVSTIRIKNMVCERCRRVVTEELSSIGLRPLEVKIGEALVEHEGVLPIDQIRFVLQRNGFDIVEDRNNALVELIKKNVIELIYSGSLTEMNLKMSEYLERLTNKDYRYISTVFSQTAGLTIEKYIIAQKIERVKELLIYDEKSLSDIAHELGYSSVAYLSNQFKSETKLSPTEFKKQTVQARKSIDSIGS